MRVRNFLVVLFAMLVFLPLAARRASGQTTTTGAIAGTVTDPTGAVIAGADVRLKDNARGTTQSAKTDSSGNYRFSLLTPGSYTVTVSATGFQSVSRTIRANLGTVATADIKMALGARSETVTVTEAAPLLQTQNANVGTTINEQTVQQIPNPGNDLTFTAELAPGVVANTAGGGLGNFSSFGLGADANLFTIDGMDDNDPFLNLNNSGATDLMLGNDEVQEVSVIQNQYSAQYGGLAGAQINYITKSGTNQFHGRATYYWNGRAFNANNYFNNEQGVPRSFVNANSWGADIGGPLIKNKVFWYFNTEGLYLVIPTSAQAFIPSPAFASATEANIASIFGPTSTEEAFYTSMFDLWSKVPGYATLPAASGGGCDGSETTFNAYLPGTTTPFGDPSAGNFSPCAVTLQSNVSNKTHDYIVVGRMDWNLTNNDKMYVRIQKEHGFQAGYTDPISPLFNLVSDQPEYQGQYQWTHIIGSSAVNQFNAAAQWYQAQFNTPDNAAALAAFPTTLIIGTGAFGSQSSGTALGGLDFILPQGRNVTQLQLSDDFSETYGNHTFHVGLNFRRNDISDFDNGVYTSGYILPFNLDAFFMGGYDPNTAGANNPNISILQQAFAQSSEFPVAMYTLTGYFQDDWRISPNFMLNLGLRLGHQSNPICPTNCFAAPSSAFTALDHNASIPYNQAIQIGRRQALPKLTAINPQPRIGFAWTPDLLGSRNTVIRGGFGLFYDQYPGVVVDNFAQNPPLYNLFTIGTGTNPGYITPGGTNNLFAAAAASNAAFVNGFASGATLADLNASVPGFVPPALTGATSNPKTPRVMKWSVQIQHAFGNSMSFEIGYVGNRATDLPYFNNGLNVYSPTPFADFPTAPTDPRFGVVTQINSNGYSNYNGMIMSFQRRFGTGQFSINYTWSHALDVSSNSGNPNVVFQTTQFGAANNSVSFPEDPFHPFKYNYGNADYDATHYLSANYVWTLPIRRLLFGHGWAALVNGWQVSGTVFARSGLPFTPVDGATSAAFGGLNYGSGAYIFGVQVAPGQGANCVATFGAGASVAHGNYCLNPNSFATPDLANPNNALYGVGFGNVTRNQLRGPAYFNSDFTIMKYTKLPHWEAGEFGLGFQFFNVFNHPNFQQPIGDVSSPYFGQVIAATSAPTSIYGAGLGADASPRLIQLKAQLRF